MIQTLYDIAPYLTAILTGAGGLFIGKRKRKADAAHAELENVQAAIKIWRETAEAFETKCNELMAEMEVMRKQNVEVLQKLQLARTENADLRKKIESLELKLNNLDIK